MLENLDVLIDDTTEGDISTKLASFTKRVVSERLRYQQDIDRLESMLKAHNKEFNLPNVQVCY